MIIKKHWLPISCLVTVALLGGRMTNQFFEKRNEQQTLEALNLPTEMKSYKKVFDKNKVDISNELMAGLFLLQEKPEMDFSKIKENSETINFQDIDKKLEKYLIKTNNIPEKNRVLIITNANYNYAKALAALKSGDTELAIELINKNLDLTSELSSFNKFHFQTKLNLQGISVEFLKHEEVKSNLTKDQFIKIDQKLTNGLALKDIQNFLNFERLQVNTILNPNYLIKSINEEGFIEYVKAPSINGILTDNSDAEQYNKEMLSIIHPEQAVSLNQESLQAYSYARKFSPTSIVVALNGVDSFKATQEYLGQKSSNLSQ